MKKFKVWILPVLFLIVGLLIAISGCLLGTGFQDVTSGVVISGDIDGVTDNATVTIKDDLGESTTADYYPDYCYYGFSVSPGVRTLTYSCTGYLTVTRKVSAIGRITINVTMLPATNGSDAE